LAFKSFNISTPIEDLHSYIPPREVLLEVSEHELVEACKKGSRKAQKRVYELFAGRMLLVCQRYAKNKEHAKDLMHDGFIKVFLNMDGFREKSSLQTWITRIMINNCISEIRKEVRKGIKVDIEHLQLPDDEAEEFEIVDKSHITAQMVFDKMQELPLGYRTVLSMYILDGYTHAEIAEQLGIAAGTSKSQLAKAKRLLAKILKEAYL